MKLIGIPSLVVAGALVGHTRERPYDITARDDKNPWMASFQTKTGAYAVDAGDEYGFGSGHGANVEALGASYLRTIILSCSGWLPRLLSLPVGALHGWLPFSFPASQQDNHLWKNAGPMPLDRECLVLLRRRRLITMEE